MKKFDQFFEQTSLRERIVEIQDFVDIYIDKIAEYFNVQLIKKLGSGSYGIAYLVKDKKGKRDKVLKITTDNYEANAAYLTIGKNFKHYLIVYVKVI